MNKLMRERSPDKENGFADPDRQGKAVLDTPFLFYEFFAGTGMARMGLADDWVCVWANDNDPRKREIYEHNFGSTHFDPRDVFEVAQEISSGSVANSDSPSFQQDVDMAWASFPCQDLSLAGWRRGMSAERSGAYWPFWRIMRSLYDGGQRPPVIVIENVVGLLSGGAFRGLCESLAALDMKFGALVVDAKHFIPQSRPRVFIVAVDAGVDLLGLAGSKPSRSTWHPKSVLEAERGLPEALKGRWAWWKLKDVSQTRPSISEVFESEPKDTRYHTASETERLVSLMAPLHLQRLEEAKRAGETRVGFLYKRTRNGAQRAEVRFDGLAGCLRTPKGGSSRQTVVVVKESQVRTRLLSRIEAARLMGIPLSSSGRLPGSEQDFFPEGFSYNDAYMAMGDGVAVPVVRHLAKSLLNPLSQRARRARASNVQENGALSAGATDADEFLPSVDQHIARWTATRPRGWANKGGKMSKGRPYADSIQEKVRHHTQREVREPIRLTRGELADLGHLTKDGGQRSVYAAVRAMCVDCMGGTSPQHSKEDILRCTSVGCPLWPFRFGKRLETVASRLTEAGDGI